MGCLLGYFDRFPLVLSPPHPGVFQIRPCGMKNHSGKTEMIAMGSVKTTIFDGISPGKTGDHLPWLPEIYLILLESSRSMFGAQCEFESSGQKNPQPSSLSLLSLGAAAPYSKWAPVCSAFRWARYITRLKMRQN